MFYFETTFRQKKKLETRTTKISLRALKNPLRSIKKCPIRGMKSNLGANGIRPKSSKIVSHFS